MTRQPLLEVPQEMPIDLQAGTRDARDMTKEERICAGAELGNAAFAYVREHQRGLRWYTGDITPNSGLLDELLIWPDSLNVALVLKDGCRVHATDAIGMGACGPRMTDCAAIRVYPQRQPVTYQTINVREASQCLLLIAFPATYDPSDVRDLVLVSSSGEPSDSDMPSLQAKEEDDR